MSSESKRDTDPEPGIGTMMAMFFVVHLVAAAVRRSCSW